MTLPAVAFDIPPPEQLRALREEIGLSQDELADELGFSGNGRDIVRAWEHGFRNGQPCKPTPLAWRCFRLLVVCHRTLDIDDLLSAVVHLRENMPEKLQ